MFGFIERLYRNPPPGSVCYSHGRAIQCLSGLPREIASSFLLAVGALIVIFVVSMVISMIRG